MGLIFILLIPFVLGLMVGMFERSKSSAFEISLLIFCVLILAFFVFYWIKSGSFWGAFFLSLLLCIPFSFGLYLTGISETENSSSVAKGTNDDIPNYWNWDRIYDKLSGEVDVIGPITTMEKAVEQFYKDYHRTERMFAELDGLQKVAKMERTHIKMFFNDMEAVIKTGSGEFDNRGGGEFYIRYNRNGISRSYHHWPYRKNPVYDQLMWRGEIVNNGSWLRYGLNNEENIQYWRIDDGTTRTGIDALRGEVEYKRVG
ncbi:MAG: hypothetical protein IJ762_05110 [Bacteroidaceae bacterium]|nr:hypothetical protein [Bacteroidaceae bacterium]